MCFKYKYDFSIVMGYYNRKRQTMKTLNAFNYYTSLNYNFEVIIIDDNSKYEHQLDEEVKQFSYPIKYIKVTPQEKGDRINPCVPFNMGFKNAEGRIVVIQNPECIHVNNLLGYLDSSLTYNDYMAFSCYNCTSQQLTCELLNNIELINDLEFTKRNKFCWYNHPTIRPVHYHFCAGIMNDNLKILGGFDETFAEGHSYDDNEILLSINKCLKLNISTIDPTNGFVIHQWHTGGSLNDANDAKKINKLHIHEKKLLKNKNLYIKYQKQHNLYNFNFPKILHLYWDGSPLSYLNLLTVLSFNKYHFGWKINIYCPIKRNVHISWKTHEQKKKYIGTDYFDELKDIKNVNIHHIDTDKLPFKFKEASEVIKSDYFRLYILNKFGGLWSDFDIIYTNNIEQFFQTLDSRKKFIIFRYKWHSANKNVYPVGLFLSQKNNSILNSLLANIESFYNKENYQCLGTTMFEKIFEHYRQFPEIKKILTSMNLRDLQIVSADCYLKVKWNELNLLYKDETISVDMFENTSKIFGIHWFNGADIAKNYCNKLNIKDLKMKRAKCLIDRFVKKYL